MAAWPALSASDGDAAFHGGHALLQHIVGRVHDAGVNIAGHGQIEEVGAVLGVVKFVGDGLVNRHRHRVSGGLAFIAGVDGLGFELHSRFSSAERGVNRLRHTLPEFALL